MFKSLFNGSDLKYRKLILFVSVIVITCFILAQGTFAAEQTSKQGLNKTKNVISYQKYPITNDNQNKVDPWLLNKFKNRLKISTNNTNFRTRELGLKSLPTVWQGGLPSTGNVKVLVLLVDFPDYPHSSSETVELAQSKFFGDGNPNNYPYESLKNYYLRSSYGKLNINGTVLGWYTAQHNRDYYKDKGSSGREDVLMEVLSYYNTLGHDFSQYDNDNNGKLDAIYVKWTGPDTGWSTFFWACQSNFRYNPTFSVDGKKLNKYIWSWFTNEKYGDKSDSIRTDIHETGHILGLPDYYDYKAGVGPDGGVGKLDMMDGNWGDHNCFSKFLLGWIDPTVISSGQQLINLHPTGSWPEAVIIMTNATLNPFQEFFMVQYRKKVLNDTTYPTNGLLIWHIDGRLKADGSNFLYDNSYTDHKLLRLMEADGLEEIEKNVKANVGDFYVSPNTFSKFTNPNSDNYNSQTTGVRVDNISTSGNTISARFGFYYDLYGLSNPLNNQELEWNSTGTTNPYTGSPSVWQKYILNDEYVQSGPIYYNGKSELSTVVNQPGTLKFWWAVSSQDNYDTLTFYDNEDPIYTISGEHWYLDQITYNISTPGQHILSWRYAKNDDFIVGFYDCGLLDKVEWTPDENTPPLVSIDPITGFYNSDQTITLTMNEPGNIYYTLNGSTPTLDSNLYTGPFNITSNTNLMILAQDLAGNLSYYTEHYLFDKKSPTASSTPQSGTYFTDQLVRLTMDEEGSIYYTTNGLNPNTNSNLYTGPISITSTTTLKYIALDLASNFSPVYTAPFTIIKINNGDALDNTNLSWTTGGDASWFGESLTNHDGVDAAQSGKINNNGVSWIQTTINQAGVLKWWWKVSSDSTYDYFKIYLDEQPIMGITGEEGWIQRVLNLDGGTHTIRWSYEKNKENIDGQDCAWLDQVEWIPGVNSKWNIHTYALLVGVTNYQNPENNLKFPDDDLYDMYDICSRVWNLPTSHIYTLLDSQASKTNIQNTINTLANLITKQDKLVFYFSGHGSYGTDLAPLDETDGYDEYICPWDSVDKSTFIRDDELVDWFAVVKSTKILCIFDSCFSGGMAKSINIMNNSKSGFTDLAGYNVLMASNDNETSLERSDLKNGVFTYYLIEALLGYDNPNIDLNHNHTISVEEAYQYTYTQVLAQSIRHVQFSDPDPNNQYEVLDKTPPTASTNTSGGLSNSNKTVILVMSEDGYLYYTVNGETPTMNSTVYTGPISISSTTLLQFIAFDLAGNASQVYAETYTIDKEIPKAFATPSGGLSNSNKSIVLIMSEDGSLYYTTNETIPTVYSSKYTESIYINSTTILKFIAVDLAGNISSIYTETYTIDKISPTATITPLGGLYNSDKNVILKMNEIGSIYYTLNGNEPTKKDLLYNRPIIVSHNTLLKFLAIDLADNKSQVYTETYIIDKIKPTAHSNPIGGIYNTNKIVLLNMSEKGIIYYTIDGTTPTNRSNKYSESILITNSKILKFLAIDTAGNQSTIYTEKYDIDKTKPVVLATPIGGNYNTNKSITLKINEIGTIYYSTNGMNPTTSSVKYSKPLLITSSKILKFFAMDIAGNKSPIYTQTYKIDKIPPKITSTIPVNSTVGYSRLEAITIKFTENILKNINWSKISLKDLLTNKFVPITKSISNNLLILKTNSRSPNNWYQVFIPDNAIKDLVGNNLLASYIFRFKTRT